MPSRYLLFGNSGAGKSTLAQALVREHGLAHLDLDPFAWVPGRIGVRRAVSDSLVDIRAFVSEHPRWVIEGCYADLLEPLLPEADAVRFLNPDVEVCVAHCRARPWESHKYASKAEQDRHLEFLLGWVREYPTREGPMGLAAHRALFEAFAGDKLELG